MEITFLLIILAGFAVISFVSYLIARKVFKTLTARKNVDAKLISAVIFLVSFLVILVVLLNIMDISHAFDGL